MYHVYLDNCYYKSVRDVYEIELELGSAIQSLSFGANRRVFVTLSDEFIPEDFIKNAA